MKLRWVVVALCGSFFACVGGTETGNPSFTGTLEYNAYTTNAAQVALSIETDAPEPSAILVDQAWLVLDDVGFFASASDAGACDDSAQAAAHSKGIGPGDHAAEAFATAEITLSAGEYCGVRVPFVPASATRVAQLAGAPQALAGHSILITGTLPDGRDFELRSATEHEVFLLADEAAFEMSRDAGNVLIGFDVAQWLSTLDFSAATADDDGVVYIDGERNTQQLAAFEAEVAAGTALFRDPDDDGAVKSDSERLASARE